MIQFVLATQDKLDHFSARAGLDRKMVQFAVATAPALTPGLHEFVNPAGHDLY